MAPHLPARRTSTKGMNYAPFNQGTPDAFYFLGAMATDGNVSGNRPTLYQVDSEWLEAVRRAVWPGATVRPSSNQPYVLLDAGGREVERSYRREWLEMLRSTMPRGATIATRHQTLYALQARDQPIVDWLAAFGVRQRYEGDRRKSEALRVPANLPPGRERDYLRGVIDGDGSIYIHNHRQTKRGRTYEEQYPIVSVVAGNREFIEDLKHLIDRVGPDGCNIYLYEKESGGTDLVPTTGITYTLRISCWSAYKFLRWLYYADDLLCLRRKRAVAEAIFELYASGRKRNVELVRAAKQEARAFRGAGCSYGMIASLMGIAREQVKNHTKGMEHIDVIHFLPGRRTDMKLVEHCRRLRSNGCSFNLISDETGVPPGTVQGLVQDIIVKTRYSRAGDLEEARATKERIEELGRDGYPLAEIVRMTGASAALVKKILPTIVGRVRTKGARKEVTPQVEEEMRRLEMSLRSEFPAVVKRRQEIARRVDRSPSTVKNVLADLRRADP